MIVLCGLPGTGKTLYLTYLCVQRMLGTIFDVYNVYDEIDTLNKYGFHFTKRFEHLASANFNVNTDGTAIPNMRIYKVNPYKLGFYDKDFKTDIFPFDFVHYVTEAQNYWPSELWDYLPQRVKTFWQTKRHADIDFVLDCQNPMEIAKPVRSLSDEFYQFIKCEHLTDYGRWIEKPKNENIVKHRWTYRVFKGNLAFEEFLKTNNSKLCDIKTEVSDKSYFNNYDSKFCRELHLRGRNNEDFNIKHFGEEDDSDIFTVPDGYFVSKKDRNGVKKGSILYYD